MDGIQRIRELLSRLLDGGYNQAIGPVIAAYTRENPLLKKRLADFQAEAQRLADLGQTFSYDNPIARALLADLADALRREREAMNQAAGNIQQTGIKAGEQAARKLTFLDFNQREIGVVWNQPDPRAIAQVVSYASGSAWQSELDKFQGGITGRVNEIMIRGIIGGKNPLTIAREISQVVDTMPRYAINNLMRTMQLTAYRDATNMSYLANADKLDYQIRIAALDGRCCMACVALHGTRLEIGQRVTDHHQGRCTSIAVVKGYERTVQSGSDWFEGLSQERQQKQMGMAAWQAWQAGDVTLADFAQKYTDSVFGEMVKEASLKGLLGPAAQKYYQ